MKIQIGDERTSTWGGYEADFSVVLDGGGHTLKGIAYTGPHAQSSYQARAKSLTYPSGHVSGWVRGLTSTGRPQHSRNRLRNAVSNLAKIVQRRMDLGVGVGA